MLLKLRSNGIIHRSTLKSLREESGVTDKTFRKYLHRLEKLNFIGHNRKTGWYFIRSFKAICDQRKICRRNCFEFTEDMFPVFIELVFAAIVSKRVNSIRYYHQRNQRVAINSAIAFQPLGYYGVSNATIGTLIGKSKIRASQMKNRCARLRLLQKKHRYRHVFKYDDRNQARMIINKGSDIPNKYILSRGNCYRQLHDEIIPMIRLKSIR